MKLIHYSLTAVVLFVSLISAGKAGKITRKGEKTVINGMQEWTAKNLDVSVFRNGDSIPEAKTDGQWRQAAIDGKPAWCYYGNDPANAKKYGKLYNWFAINDPRGICPEGWHIPSDEEWDNLARSLRKDAGTKLKSAWGWSSGGNGSDSIGFSALPAGIRYHSGMFDDLGEYAHFWTSSPKNGWLGSQGTSGRFLSFRESQLGENPITGYRKGSGISVRCVRRALYDGYEISPSNPPNQGFLFVDHERSGRSGHVGNAIAECRNGDILAFYVNGSGVIWSGHGAAGWTEYKRSTDGGKTWGEPVVFAYSKKIWDENEKIKEDLSFNDYRTAYVTAVVTAPNGNLVAFVSRRLPVLPPEKQGKPVYLISNDNGHTWSEPRLVDERAPFDEVTLIHSDGGAFVSGGNIYAVFLGGGSSDYNEGQYSFYVSEDNGETFNRISFDMFKGTSSGKHMCANVLEDGSFIIYSFNPKDEFKLPYVISKDKGYTWSEVKYTYMEKRMRSAQLSDKIGDYYFLTGRSGNTGDDPTCLVLYVSRDGINWDRGMFLNNAQQGIDAYTAVEVTGKYDPAKPKRLLIQSSIGYSGLRNNIHQWWIQNVRGSK